MWNNLGHMFPQFVAENSQTHRVTEGVLVQLEDLEASSGSCPHLPPHLDDGSAPGQPRLHLQEVWLEPRGSQVAHPHPREPAILGPTAQHLKQNKTMFGKEIIVRLSSYLAERAVPTRESERAP